MFITEPASIAPAYVQAIIPVAALFQGKNCKSQIPQTHLTRGNLLVKSNREVASFYGLVSIEAYIMS
jgi:hypothetical protein